MLCLLDVLLALVLTSLHLLFTVACKSHRGLRGLAWLAAPLIKQDKLTKSKQLSVTITIWSAIDRRLTWEALREKIALDSNYKVRSSYRGTAVAMYWVMKKYDMARQAAQDWVEPTAYESLDAEESKRAYTILNQEEKIKKNYVYEQDHQNQAKTQKITELYAQMAKHDCVRYSHYRESRIALQLLNWSAARNDEPSRRALAQVDYNENFFGPQIYLKFDSDLAALMGVSEKEFRDIQKEAEQIAR